MSRTDELNEMIYQGTKRAGTTEEAASDLCDKAFDGVNPYQRLDIMRVFMSGAIQQTVALIAMMSEDDGIPRDEFREALYIIAVQNLKSLQGCYKVTNEQANLIELPVDHPTKQQFVWLMSVLRKQIEVIGEQVQKLADAIAEGV